MDFIQSMSAGYPTKDEILAEPLNEYSDEILGILKTFKRKWKVCSNDEERFYCLKEMILDLARQYDKTPTIEMGEQYCFKPTANTIDFGPVPSIISSLHELGHAIFGASEKDACRFSVHLFKRVFPKAYERLEWDGHMLKRKQYAEHNA